MEKIRYLTLWLCGTIIAVFAVQQLLPIRWAWQVGVVEWQFFGAMIAHGSTGHLLGNLFGLSIFGLVLEGRVGTKRLAILLLAAGILGNLAGILGGYNRVIGISGAIYGVFGALAVLRPFMSVWVSAIPAPMILVAAGWTFMDLVGAFAGGTGTGHLAHLAGLVAGLGFGFAWRKRFADPPRRAKQRRKDPVLDSQLDEFEQRYMRGR
jgi:uncharacterized protein